MIIEDVNKFSKILNGRFINGVKNCKDLFYEDVEVYPSSAYILFENELHKVDVFNEVTICKLPFGNIVNNHFVVNDVILTNGEDVPLKFFVHPYFWKRFNNDSPEYGLNFISDDMSNRIIDNFDSCVYGTVFID